MAQYKIRQGVVCTKICGVNLLVPTREASVSCPYIQKLSFITYAVWQMVAKGKSTEEIYKMYQTFTKKDEQESREKVDKILDAFLQKGFLISQGESEG